MTSASRRPLPGLAPLLAAALLPALSACPASPYPEVAVDLAGAPAPPEQSRLASRPTLRFSVAGMQSPQDTFAAYSRLLERLEPKLGARIELVQRRTYHEVNELLISGQLDAALLCTGGYVELERRAPGSVEVVALPVVQGRTTYQSYLVVPATSRATALADLRGRRFAFTDELSLSGFAYPSHLLRRAGADSASFFASTVFTRSHDRSIDAVAKGLVDGAAVDSLVYDQLVAHAPELAARTRVIHRSPPYGTSPVVVSTRLPPERRAEIREALLHLQADPSAQAALRLVGFDGFGLPPPGAYQDAAALVGASR